MIKGKRYFYPRTRIANWAFWFVILGFLGIVSNYWISIAIGWSMGVTGLFFVIPLIAGGIMSIIAIWKYGERAIFSYLTSVIGILFILLVIAELVFTH